MYRTQMEKTMIEKEKQIKQKEFTKNKNILLSVVKFKRLGKKRIQKQFHLTAEESMKNSLK